MSGYFKQLMACALLCLPNGAAAEPSGLSLELNAAQSVERSCLLSFLIRNDFEVDIDQLVVEAVLFTTQGQVSSLTLFDLGSVPQGRPRVRQFQVPDASCDGLAMVLINGIDTCAGEGLEPRVCEAGLSLSSRANLALEG